MSSSIDGLRSLHHSSSSSSRVGQSTRDIDIDKRHVMFRTSPMPSLEVERNFPEQYTPYTDLDDYLNISTRNAPDLTLKCRKCTAFLNLDELADHEQLHSALKLFGFEQLAGLNLHKLNTKRSELLKTLLNKYIRKSSPSSSSKNYFALSKANEWRFKFAQLNSNYELLKAYLDNRFESCRQLKNSHVELNFKGRCWLGSPNDDFVVAIGSCSNQNSMHRIQMEDSSVVLDKFGGNPNLTYLGIFDGFDGDVASYKCSSQLHLAVLHQLSRVNNSEIKFVKEAFEYDEINNLGKYEKVEEGDDDEKRLTKLHDDTSTDKLYHRSFKRAYRLMDKLLARGHNETSRMRWSGATACTCVLETKGGGGGGSGDNDSWVHMANCGDVEAIYVIYDDSCESAQSQSATTNRIRRNFRVLTRLHTVASCIKDRDFIERNGGKLFETSNGQQQICGLYSITRGLGFHGDKDVKTCISPKPWVSTFKIEPKHVALVIATKGLWNALSYDQVAELVLNSLPSTSKKNKAAERTAVSPSVRALLRSNKEKLVDKANLLHIEEADYLVNTTSELLAEDENDQNINNNIIEKKKAKSRPKTAPLSRNKGLENIPYKSNSDIYPYNTSLNNQDDSYSSANFSVNNLNENDLNSESRSAQAAATKAQVHLNNRLKPTSTHVVQVDEYELDKWTREAAMTHHASLHLDLAESVSEMLVNAALLAGSRENITVTCVLLPGSVSSSSSSS